MLPTKCNSTSSSFPNRPTCKTPYLICILLLLLHSVLLSNHFPLSLTHTHHQKQQAFIPLSYTQAHQNIPLIKNIQNRKKKERKRKKKRERKGRKQYKYLLCWSRCLTINIVICLMCKGKCRKCQKKLIICVCSYNVAERMQNKYLCTLFQCGEKNLRLCIFSYK